jgi:adenine-specific DNA-methyltransferase
MVFAKNADDWRPNNMPRTNKQDKAYKNPDNDPRGPWKPSDLSARNFYSKGVFSIFCPSGRVIDGPPPGNYWRVSEEKLQELVKDNRIWFGVDGNNVPSLKRFLSEVKQGIVPQTYWPYEEVGHTQDAKKEIKILFPDKIPFSTPKPSQLIQRIVQITSQHNSIILDSFAGSGTTAHAVLNMNKADGGNRKFILVEMEDYAETITAERVRRVIDGYSDVEGTGGSFGFYELGEPLLLENRYINESLQPERIREYVYYMETKCPISVQIGSDNQYFLGKHDNTAYYFYYEKNNITTLDGGFLSTLQTFAEGYVVYADQCAMSDENLKKRNVVFKKIPRDIARR